MTTTINASTSAGLVQTADTSGSLALQTAGTTAITVDTSQNVGIGTTSPSTYGKFVTYSSGGYFSVDTNGQVISAQLLDVATAGGRFTGYSSRGALGAIHIEQTTTSADGGYMSFRTCASGSTSTTERMRIDSSGNLLVGTTSLINNSRLTVKATGANGVIGTQVATNGVAAIDFLNAAGGEQGYIVVNAGSVQYLSVSDYRLKENINPISNALSKVAQLKPVTYKWKADGTDAQGFIAHELQAVVPECVSGEKDAVDADGNPKYQGIDTSFLVATLTAALQETKALIDTQAETLSQQATLINALTARIEALENK